MLKISTLRFSDGRDKLWKNYGRLRQQAAGEESLSGALPADGRTVADAPGCRAEAVPT